MSYTELIRDLLDQQYPNVDGTKTIIITSMQLHLLPALARPYFLRYHQLETLALNKCDLRNLQNFPKIQTLKFLDLSENSLQGSLNYLMPLVSLKYLNIANNMIGDFRKLQPLQMIQDLQVYVIGNPFIEGQMWKNKVKQYGIKVVKEPKKIEPVVLKVKEEEKKEEKKVEEEKKAINPGIMGSGMSFLFKEHPGFPAPNNSRMIVRHPRRPDIEGRNRYRVVLEDMKLMREANQEVPHLVDSSEQEESEELNEGDDSENQYGSEKEEEDDDELIEDFEPIFDVFGDDLNVQDEDEEEDEEQEEHSGESS